jgi:hypothetical protein
MIYFRRPPFWKFCHPERAFSRISDSLTFLDLEALGAGASGAAITVAEPGAADTGMDNVGGVAGGPWSGS